MKKLAMVWTCPPLSHRRARKGEPTSHFLTDRQQTAEVGLQNSGRQTLVPEALRFANSPQIDSNRYRSRPCPFTNTSARNATTSSKPSCTARKRLSALNATRKNLSRSCRSSLYRPKADRLRQRLLGLAGRVAIPAAQAHAA